VWGKAVPRAQPALLLEEGNQRGWALAKGHIGTLAVCHLGQGLSQDVFCALRPSKVAFDILSKRLQHLSGMTEMSAGTKDIHFTATKECPSQNEVPVTLKSFDQLVTITKLLFQVVQSSHLFTASIKK
jgi:hypothetical protein